MVAALLASLQWKEWRRRRQRTAWHAGADGQPYVGRGASQPEPTGVTRQPSSK
jgi:hypothetical protein